MDNILEIASFKIQEKITDEEFILLSQKFENRFVKKQNGFIERKFVKSKEGLWADIVIWKNIECAMNVEKVMAQSGSALEYMSCIKENSITINRMNVINLYK